MTDEAPTPPRVSVCIPAFNCGAFIDATLASVWRQSFRNFEVVVVDDGSSDETVSKLQSQSDPRLKVISHHTNLGQAQTVDDCIRHASGELVKFLDHDDLLRADCLQRMVDSLDAHPTASFVFSRRRLLIEGDDSPALRRWLDDNRSLHTHYDPLAPINDGPQMLSQWIIGGMARNWIAEPAGVMARKACLAKIGGRSRRVLVIADMDFWARLMTCGDVAFIDAPLYDYRFSLTGMTGDADESDRQWLDPLWSAEGILRLPLPDQQRQELVRMRFLLARRAFRRGATHLATRQPGAGAKIVDLARYVGYRMKRVARRPAPLFEPLEPDRAFT